MILFILVTISSNFGDLWTCWHLISSVTKDKIYVTSIYVLKNDNILVLREMLD